LIPEEPMVWSCPSCTLTLLIFWPFSVHSFQPGHVAYVSFLLSHDVAIFNTNCAANWQGIDLTTMAFPSAMRIDYVRVYQRVGYENVGCDPAEYPTMDYINRHPAAYSSASCSQ
jgi:hypothetical protein